MDGNGDNQDLAAMKKLLTSWHVPILYDLFKEEDITFSDLKMMQICHINSLLKNYKMGVRIRFEHHFTNWRNKIGIPLKNEAFNHQAICYCHCKGNFENDISNQYCMENTATTTDATANVGMKSKRSNQDVLIDQKDFEETQALLSPRSLKSDSSLNKIFTANEMTNFTAIPNLGSPNHLPMNNTDEEGENGNITLNVLADLLSNSIEETPPKFPSKPTPDKSLATLKQILTQSGTRGLSIIKFYKEKKRLTNIHRAQLIQIIVEFFDENDYHLSLNASHILEWEILKMFPTEKLEYYRTEKRGKIYVKFSNMKRYKRERSNKAKSEMETPNLRPRRLQPNGNNNQLDGLVFENPEEMNYDDYPVCAEPEIEVKEENVYDHAQDSE